MDTREKEIMERFKAFIKPEKGMQRTLMCFGFECGKGWYNLLENLFTEIEKLNPPEEFEIIQVKEKFGGLRVYTSCSSDAIEALIDEACDKADKTCEVCGMVGCLCSNGGWYKTLCQACVEKDKEGRLGNYKPVKTE